ncbi:mechanosensitive ion channel family protein [Parasediminibacterium sp. JCM 36343]|uniref:mechanosensitive ion channel family protein n=1 Tax=Parasediminibacterium sp. JCM 36343 TaxID=3374279 RepID=UPI00397C16AF
MFNFLHQTFYNNTVYSYLSVFFTIVLAFCLKKLFSKYFATILFKLVARTGKRLDKQAFLSLIVQPLENFLLLFISFVALDKLNYPAELNFKIYRVTFFQVIDAASSATLIITFTWLCLRVIDFVATVLEQVAIRANDKAESQLIVFFKDFFKMILVIMGFLLILHFSFNKDVGNLVTGLSLVGAALALATRESLENLIASFIIFFDRPFTVGDSVKVNNLTGSIEKIGLRSTRIRTEEKTYISVPNKQMVDSIVDNLSRRTQRKVVITLELSLSAKPEQLQELTPAIKQLLQLTEIVSASAFLKDTGKNAHIVEIEYYTVITQTAADFNLLREKINLAVIGLLDERAISLAAASSDIVITNVSPQSQ